MIKRGIKNYFICLKYFFTPLGTLCLGVILGFSVFIPAIASAAEHLTADVELIIEGMQIEPQNVLGEVWACITELDWSKPIEAFNTLISREWLEVTLHKSINAFFAGDYSMYVNQVNEAVNAAVTTIAAGFIVLVLFTVISVIGGYYLVKFLIRRTIAKRAFWKRIIVFCVDFVVYFGLLTLNVLSAFLWTPGIIFSSLFSFVLFGGLAFAEAYAVHGYGKLKFKQVMTLKNIGMLLLTNMIIFLMWFAALFIVILLFREITGIVIGLVLLEIASIVMDMNAESFVKDLAVNKETEIKDIPAVAA